MPKITPCNEAMRPKLSNAVIMCYNPVTMVLRLIAAGVFFSVAATATLSSTAAEVTFASTSPLRLRRCWSSSSSSSRWFSPNCDESCVAAFLPETNRRLARDVARRWRRPKAHGAVSGDFDGGLHPENISCLSARRGSRPPSYASSIGEDLRNEFVPVSLRVRGGGGQSADGRVGVDDASGAKSVPYDQTTEDNTKKFTDGDAYPLPPREVAGKYGDEGVDAFEEIRRRWSDVPAMPNVEWPVTDVFADDDGETLRHRPSGGIGGEHDGEDYRITKGLILMDVFTPHFGHYLANRAREAYGAGVVFVLSDFMVRYLNEVEGQTEHLSSRLPSLSSDDGKDLDRWASLVPFSLRGIYCESDSGLEDAERLGAGMLALTTSRRSRREEKVEDANSGGKKRRPMFPALRHDGVNSARRDKFQMNEDVHRLGGLEIVRQKMCETVEDAVNFAREMGVVCEEEEDDDEEKKELEIGPGASNDGKGGNKFQPMTFNAGNLGRRPKICSAPPSSARQTLVVVKPPRGVASDGVFLCRTLPAVRQAFAKIHGSPIFGASTDRRNSAVLVQEFAEGTEYAIDVVCKNGERKAAAIWRYDKRPANGAPFVYFAAELVDGDDGGGEGTKACEYAFAALEALGVRWGLSHVEVIVDEVLADEVLKEASTEGDDGFIEESTDRAAKTRARLVEVNCRQHNTDFCPLTDACIGYNALDMLLAAYLGDDDGSGCGPPHAEHLRLKWDDVPTLPVTRARGAVVHFVSFVKGTISRVRVDALNDIAGLESVVDMRVYPQFLEPGNKISRTVDIRSDTGWAHLVNDDTDALRRDYENILELMPLMFDTK